MRLKLLRAFCFIIIGSILFSCNGSRLSHAEITAKNGIADLTSYDFNRHEPVRLTGEWRFLYGKDDPDFSQPEYDDSGWSLTTVPSYWNDITDSGTGFAWFRVRVKIDKQNTTSCTGLYLEGANTAYKMYINGRKILQRGKPGNNKDETIPQLHPELIKLSFDKPVEDILIAVKVSNFHHRGGGLNKPVEIGSYEKMKNSHFKNETIDFIILGFILMMGLYHFILWAGRKRDFMNLYFSLFCFVIFMRTLAIGNYLERFFPDFNIHELRFIIEYISIPAGWIIFALFTHSLFPKFLSGRWLYPIIVPGVILVIIPLLTSAEHYTRFVNIYTLLLVPICIIFLISVVRASLHREPYANILLAGAFILFIAITNDILHNAFVVHTAFISQFGLAIFILSQSTILSLKFSNALNTTERLSNNLQEAVKEKTTELNLQKDEALMAKLKTEQAYAEINRLYSGIKHEMHLAKQIQKCILPQDNRVSAELNFNVKYIPLMEIGGDIYDIAGIKDGVVRILIADATGHGVGAALITMLIKGEYEKIKYQEDTPSRIFVKLNEVFFNIYRSFNLYFTGIIMDIDTNKETIVYSSAGHPAQYIIDSDEIIPLQHSGRAIGIWHEIKIEDKVIEFQKNRKILLLTDGIYEEFNENRELYGEEKFIETINKFKHFNANDIIDRIMDDLDDYVDKKQFNDDITLIGIDWVEK